MQRLEKLHFIHFILIEAMSEMIPSVPRESGLAEKTLKSSYSYLSSNTKFCLLAIRLGYKSRCTNIGGLLEIS
jgi:hypothetical protein